MDVSIKMKNSAKSRQGYCDFKTSCYTFGSIASNILLFHLKRQMLIMMLWKLDVMMEILCF